MEVAKLSFEGLKRENREENPAAAKMLDLGGYPKVS